MALKKISDERLEEVQRQLQEKLPESPPPVNMVNAADLGGVRFWTIGGRIYQAPPVSFPDGVKIMELMQRFEEHAKDDRLRSSASVRAQYILDTKEAAKLLWKLLDPVDTKWRIAKKLGLLRNPLMRSSEADIGSLLGFFYLYRMTRSIRSF